MAAAVASVLWLCGGLTPENVEEQYKEIAIRAGSARIWIDVESGVRDDQDQLDLTKVRSFLSQVAVWINKIGDVENGA